MKRRAQRGMKAADDGARIVYRAVRTPFFRKPRIIIPLAVGSVFSIGIGLGTTLGLFLAPSSESPRVEVPLEENAVSEDSGAVLPGGQPLPVAAYGSDRAREAYEGGRDDDGSLQPTNVPPITVQTETQTVEADSAEPQSDESVSSGQVPLENTAEDAAERALTHDVLAALSTPGAAPADRWRQYAAQGAPADGRPRIAIVIDDLGIDQERSARAIGLPAPLTLAIIPYGFNLTELAQRARAEGHEVLVHMPMAPMGLGVDPGPNALHRELGRAEIERRILWNLSQFDGYVGVNNHMGSRFTADRESMALVIAEIRRRGLLYLDSVTTTETQGYRLAAQAGVFHATRDVFLDNIQESGAIREQLARAERIAREQGHAIVIGHPHDETLAVLTEWIGDAPSRGFQLVPLSALVSLNSDGSES